MYGALQGLKVLDFTRVLAGPFATMILGDLGAEIIKVERPLTGDDSRYFGPYQNGVSAYYISINRNKQSITVDLKNSAGRSLILELIAEVDIVVENFRPGTMEKLGLGYEQLQQINPALIYCAISGFGHTGPYSTRPAYDAIVQAMGGIMSITGQKGGPPTRVGPSIGDITAGLYGAIGILAALQHRNVTGEGQKVDVAMLDCQVSILENAIARYTTTGQIPQPSGNSHNFIVPFEPFATADGEIMIAIGNDKLWQKFCAITKAAELGCDPCFMTMTNRYDNYQTLRPQVAAIFRTKTTAYWNELLNNNGIPCGPINTIAQLFEDPQIEAREMLIELDQPIAGKLTVPGIPIKLNKTPGKIRYHAPQLGEHTTEVLANILGYSAAQTADLRSTGALGKFEKE